jgi:phosphatidylethanolamine/phosphatidyl-N-methylethanolamine N-methyltransferase
MTTAAEPHESRIYHSLSRFYDTIFTRFFMARILSTIRGLNIPAGARVLEVGVGTGLSLSAYPEHCQVTGIDLSEEMLGHARRKAQAHGWEHVELRQMDAQNLVFANESFDYVMAFHIVTVVPDCDRLMRELTRVCRPGGVIVIINHLRSDRPWVAAIVDRLSPLTNLLGWRTTLKYEDLLATVPVKVRRRFKTSPRSLFSVIIAEKLASSKSDVSPESPRPE